MRTAVIVALCLGAVAGASAQTGTLDQSSPMTSGPNSAWFNIGPSFLVWQAQIKSGMAGQLEGIRVTLDGPAGAQLTMRIRDGGVWNTGPVLFSAMLTKQAAGQEPVFVDMTASNITLAAGQVFVMETQGNDTGCGLIGSYVAPPGTPLYPEPLYLNQNVQGDGGWKHGFQTYMLAGNPCYADCNQSGSLTIADFACFQAAFAAGNPYADCNNSTTLTIADFACFQAEFAQGCP